MQDMGQTEKPSQVKDALGTMENELQAMHVVVDRLVERLEPVRVAREEPDSPATMGQPIPERSFVVRQLFELADGLRGQRQRLETLSEEVEL